MNKLQQQADNLRNQGKTKEAIALYQKLFKIYDQGKNFAMAGGQIQMIGVCYKIDSNTTLSLKYLKLAEKYFRQHKLDDGLGNTLRDIGITYEYINKLQEAE